MYAWKLSALFHSCTACPRNVMRCLVHQRNHPMAHCQIEKKSKGKILPPQSIHHDEPETVGTTPGRPLVRESEGDKRESGGTHTHHPPRACSFSDFPFLQGRPAQSFRRRRIQKPRLLHQHHAGPVCIFRNVCKLLGHHLGGSSLTLRQSEKLPMQHAIAYEATKKAAQGTF